MPLIVSAETPFATKPVARPIANTPLLACHHAIDGGTGPCSRHDQSVCLNCGEYWSLCLGDRSIQRMGAGGKAIHPLCLAEYLAHGRCPDCGRSGNRCRCAVTVVRPYHGDRPRYATQAASVVDVEPLVGLEFEALYSNLVLGWQTRIGEAMHNVAPLILTHETDSSLGGSGVETITVPMPLSVAREAIPAVLGAIATAQGSCAHDRCGGHIHITATDRVVVGASRLNASYQSRTQLAVWEAIAGRTVGAYESIAPVLNASVDRMPPAGARGALSMPRTLETIEWRHPSGVDDPRVVIGRVELILDAIEHAASLAVGAAWGWGLYVRDRREPTPTTRYAWALLRSIGL